MARLSSIIKNMLRERIEAEAHYVSIAHRIRTNCDRLPDYYKAKTPEYYDGMRDLNRAMIEKILMDHNKYNGFNDRTSHDALGNAITIRVYYGDFT